MNNFSEHSLPTFSPCRITLSALWLLLLFGTWHYTYANSASVSEITATPALDHTNAKDTLPRKEGNSEWWRDKNKNTIIVFVHGINGDSSGTWTNIATGAIWPELLVHDEAFADADVLSYGYNGRPSEPDLLINELAAQMHDSFVRWGVFKRDGILFVAHSMGGLVVRQMMLLPHSDQIVRRISCLFLLATPHLGSDLANVVRYFFHDPALEQLGLHGRGSFCNNLIQDYLRAGFDTPCYAAYETRPTYGVTIVSSEAAMVLSNGEPLAVEADHIQITPTEGHEC
jgi:pimeloyl-ACP methyl ester carboxylesterase